MSKAATSVDPPAAFHPPAAIAPHGEGGALSATGQTKKHAPLGILVEALGCGDCSGTEL